MANLPPNRLRPLNAPRPIRVTTNSAGQPVTVNVRGLTRRVAHVLDFWRIDDEWWRETPISRVYYHLEYENGGIDTIYQDLVTGEWFWQRG